MDFFADKQISFVTAGGGHTLVITSQGEVFGWGLARNGELGMMIEKGQSESSPGDNRWAQQMKELGIADKDVEDDWIIVNKPIKLPNLSNADILTIAAGGAFTFALTKDKKLFAFGLGLANNFKVVHPPFQLLRFFFDNNAGDNGRLGTGSTVNQTEPFELLPFRNKKVVGIAPGVDHSVVVVEEEM